MKNNLIFVVFSVILLVLAGLVYWDDRQGKIEEAAEKTKNRLLDVQLDSLESFSLKKSGEEIVSLAKENDRWVITSPIKGKADFMGVETIVKAINDFKYETEVSKSQDTWSDYGLGEDEGIEVKFKSSGGAEQGFVIGDKSAIGFSVYVRKLGEPSVYAGNQYVSTAADKQLSDFRSRKLLDLKNEDVVKVTLKRPKQQFAFKMDGGDFIIEGMDTDRFVARKWIEYFVGAEASSFEDKPTQQMVRALSAPTHRLTIETKEGAPVEIFFATVDGKDLAKVTGTDQVFVMGTEFKGELDKSASYFVDKSILKFKSGDVTAVVVDGVSYTKPKDWVYADDASKTADHIRDFLVDLEFAKADEVFDKAPKDWASVLAKDPLSKVEITFTKADAPAKSTLSLWTNPKDAQKIFVKLEGQDEVKYLSASKTAFDQRMPNQAKVDVELEEEEDKLPSAEDTDF